MNAVVPDLYTNNKGFWSRLWNEIKSNHAVIDAMHEKDTVNRVFKIAHLVTTLTSAFFLLAVLYDLQYPSDNGTCEGITNYDVCISTMSPFDSTQNQCSWDDEYSECNYLEAAMRQVVCDSRH